MPQSWRDLLEEAAAGVFSRQGTARLFMALACGLVLAERGTVTGMAAAAGIGCQWRRACWFFAAAAWDPGALGLAVARMIVKYLLKDGDPLVTAVDSTFFRRWGKHVAEARWAYDGSAQGGKKTAFGHTWVILAVVVQLPFCPSPVALPVLFRLWRGKGTASHVDLAAEMMQVLARAFPGREIHVTGDAAFHGRALDLKGTTLTTRLPASAAMYGPTPPPTGRRGRPRKRGDRIGKPREAAPEADWKTVTVRIYGEKKQVQAASWPAQWYGCFKDTPGLFVLMRDTGSRKLYDLALFTLDTTLTAAQAIERYSLRWPIEPSNAAGKQVTGAGQARSRVTRAVERAVPFAFLVQSLVITWYALSCDPAAAVERRREESPWYLTKAAPSFADMHAALRAALISALAGTRIYGVCAGHSRIEEKNGNALTSDAKAA